MNGENISSFGSIINSVYSKIGYGGEESKIVNSWSRILMRIKSPVNENEGSNMAEHSRVTDIKQGILFIEVDHPGWIELIQLHKKYIMKGLSIECPELGITNLAFTLAGNRADVGKNYDYGKNLTEEKNRFAEKLEAEEKILQDKTLQVEENEGKNSERTVEMAPELAELLNRLKADMLTNSKK